MIDSTGTALFVLGTSPWAVALAIIAATFVLEDVAIVAAALLAADGTITPSLALAALVTGIFAGDLALYGLGAAARSQAWARRFIGERRMNKGRAWLKRRYISALIGARFMPGFRLPTYAASGFLQLPFLPFAVVAALAGLVWTTIVFTLIFSFGLMIVDELGVWRWLIAAALLTLVFFGPRLTEMLLPSAARDSQGE